MNDIFDYYSRVNFKEDETETILNKICIDYNLGALIDFKVIETGYEDFNVFIKTNKNKYVVKFFSNERTHKNIEHYIEVVDIISKQNYLNIPKIYKNNDTILGNYKNNTHYFVMEYIDGSTIYEMNKKISLKTIIKIIFDVLKYNCVNQDLKSYLLSEKAKSFKQYDMWSYENFLDEYYKKSKYLNAKDKELMSGVVEYFSNMLDRYKNYDKKFYNMQVVPPYMSAHNDFISTNIIISKDETPYYIDFSVSSVALNFVDIAIFGCDTVLAPNLNSSEYAKYLKIISYILYRVHIMEYNLYPTAVAVQHAIHVLIANYYKVCKNVDSDENNYFLELGRKGLNYIINENLMNKPVFNWINDNGWYERAELSEYSEYSNIKNEIEKLGLSEFIEENIKDYFKIYNTNNKDVYKNLSVDDLYNGGYNWLYSCLENLHKGDSLMAISFCNDNEWNDSNEEKEWLKLNLSALRKGIKMKRIFVYPDNKKNLVINNKSISNFVNYNNSNLELDFISESKLNEVLKDKIKEIKPGVLVFNNDIAFIDVIDNNDNRGYTIFDKVKISEFHKIYDLIKSNCD